MAAILSFLAAVVLASAHLLADRIHSDAGRRRDRLLSFAGGTSVAFVFLHLLPDVHHAQRVLEDGAGHWQNVVDHHVYLAALAGVVVYYGIEHAALQRSGRDSGDGDGDGGFFWGHISLFVLFNLLIGYLLHRQEARLETLPFAALTSALVLHFVSNDAALREHHPRQYHRVGRWLLAPAVVVGAVVGHWSPLHPVAISLLLGFAAGGIVLNALKEELPAERQGNFPAFAAGTAAYTVLVLLT